MFLRPAIQKRLSLSLRPSCLRLILLWLIQHFQLGNQLQTTEHPIIHNEHDNHTIQHQHQFLRDQKRRQTRKKATVDQYAAKPPSIYRGRISSMSPKSPGYLSHFVFRCVLLFFACLVYLKECHEDFETSWIVCNLQQSLTKRLRIAISDMTQQQYDGQSSLTLDPISTRKVYRRLQLLLVPQFVAIQFLCSPLAPTPRPCFYLYDVI